MTNVAAVIPTLRDYAGRTRSLPTLCPADRLDHLAGDEIQHVVVRIRGSEARRRPDVPEPPRNLLAIVCRGRPPEQIARAQPEAAPVDEQIADRELARDERIPHLEGRQVPDDRRVPFDLALFDEQASAVAVNSLVFDAIPNSVCASTSAGSPSLRTP